MTGISKSDDISPPSASHKNQEWIHYSPHYLHSFILSVPHSSCCSLSCLLLWTGPGKHFTSTRGPETFEWFLIIRNLKNGSYCSKLKAEELQAELESRWSDICLSPAPNVCFPFPAQFIKTRAHYLFEITQSKAFLVVPALRVIKTAWQRLAAFCIFTMCFLLPSSFQLWNRPQTS